MEPELVRMSRKWYTEGKGFKEALSPERWAFEGLEITFPYTESVSAAGPWVGSLGSRVFQTLPGGTL